MPLILPPPQQNPGIAGQIGQNVLAFLQTRLAMQQEQKRHQQEQEDRDLAQKMLKLKMDQLKVESLNAERDAAQRQAKNQIDTLTGAPAPVGDISNGVMGVRGGEMPDLFKRFEIASGRAPNNLLHRIEVPSGEAPAALTIPRLDTSGMQAIGRHPQIAMPGAEGAAPVMVRPPSQEELQAAAQQKAQLDLANLFNKTTVETTARRQAEAANPVPGAPHAITSPELALAAARGNKEAAVALGWLKKTTSGGEKTSALTPEGEMMAALQFRKSGKLPPLGFDSASKTRIINRAASLSPDEIASLESGGLDLAGNAADYAADKTSLATLQRTRDAVTSFEKTASQNIDVFLKEAGKVVDTGSPLANRPARYITGELLGSKNIAAFNAARTVALAEAAKVITSPSLSGVLSDSARKEVEALSKPDATLAQAVSAMRILKQDMANRATNLDTTLAEIRGRIKRGYSANTAPGNRPPLESFVVK